jgi:hypothetical protein
MKSEKANVAHLCRWTFIGIVLAAISLAPIPLRLWLGDSGRWFIPSHKEAIFFPWRDLIEDVVKLETMLIIGLILGALLGSIASLLVRAVDPARQTLAALRWALVRPIPWIALGLCALALAFATYAQALAIVFSVVTYLLLPWITFDRRFAAFPTPEQKIPLTFAVTLQNLLLIVLLFWLAKLDTASIPVLVIEVATWFVLLASIMRRAILPTLLRDQRWLSVRWIASSLTLVLLFALLIAPLSAWLMFVHIWLAYEVPQLEHSTINLMNVHWLRYMAGHSVLLLLPIEVYFYCAQGRLAWLCGVATLDTASRTDHLDT